MSYTSRSNAILEIHAEIPFRFIVNHVLDSKNPRMTAKCERISQCKMSYHHKTKRLRPFLCIVLNKSSSSKINHSQLSLPSSVNKKNFGSTANTQVDLNQFI